MTPLDGGQTARKTEGCPRRAGSAGSAARKRMSGVFLKIELRHGASIVIESSSNDMPERNSGDAKHHGQNDVEKRARGRTIPQQIERLKAEC